MTLAGSLFLDLMWSLIGVEPIGPARTLEVPSIEPTLDGWVGFNTNTRQQFDDFLVLIERPDLLDDPDWVSVASASPGWTSGTPSSTPGPAATPPPTSSSGPRPCASPWPRS